MDNPIKVGVIGCGAIAQIMHIPYAVDYEHFDLVALSDAYQPVLDAVADRYHVKKRYIDWHDMMADDEIEAVIICHSGSHHDSILAALDEGKHIFVEKPLAWNLREGREIEAAVAESDVTVQIGYHKRYDPGYRYAREQVQNMTDLGLARVTVLHPPNEMGLSLFRLRRGNGIFEDGHIDVVSWDEQVKGQLNAFAGGSMAPLVDEALGDRKEDPRLRLAYGLWTISLIHQVYTITGFLGMPERVIHHEIWREGMSIHALLQYPNDVRCTIDWHFLSHIKDYREEYAFLGNHERVFLRLPSPYFKNAPSPVTIQGGEGELSWEKKVIVSWDEAFRNELLSFYENVRHNKTPATTVTEAVQHMQLIQDLIDAAN